MISQKDIAAFYKFQGVLERSDNYIYLLPHQGLRSRISNYTITFPGEGLISDNYTVVPHASGTIVFAWDGRGMSSQLFGPATMPCAVGRQANKSELLFIIEFQPAGLYGVTGAGQKELTDRIFPFETVNAALERHIAVILDRSQSVYELVTDMDRLLLSHLQTAYPAELNASVQRVIKHMGNISIKELSGSAYYSERQLNRMFDRYMGMSVKTFSRLVRINKAVRFLQDPGCSITNACHLSGFYDLPHFIHEFKSICSITPKDYRNRMSDFYSEIAKF